MQHIRLVVPDLSHKQQALAYRQAHFDMGEHLLHGGAALQAKVLALFLTETEFAAVANGKSDFSYSDAYRKYHTSEEMAEFLLQLYDSNQVVGSVSREDFSFTLSGPRCSHASPSK